MSLFAKHGKAFECVARQPHQTVTRCEPTRGAMALEKQKGQLFSGAGPLIRLVGVAGFELATPCTPCKCATRLRYTPTAADYNPRQSGGQFIRASKVDESRSRISNNSRRTN